MLRTAFTTGDMACSTARSALELRYAPLLQPTSRFNRKLVSYQANKATSTHRWFKFKEGFSAQLVKEFVREFGLGPSQRILDPFAGVSTTLMVAEELGIDATGIEVMPIGELIWKAKSGAAEYDIGRLREIREWVAKTRPQRSSRRFPHIPITRQAFDDEQEAQLMWYKEKFASFDVDGKTGDLLRFVLVSILEDISYTSKDGQFLRWDSRSNKMKMRNQQRIAEGKRPVKQFHKRQILHVQQAILRALDLILFDVSQSADLANARGDQELISGSVLDLLPQEPADKFDAVITSPPYCNRYDYTRTYALELAFIGVDQEAILELRQRLLSCTVENRTKLMQLRQGYAQFGRLQFLEQVLCLLSEHDAFQEILTALIARSHRGEMNNRGIITMVEGYFTEMAVVISELFRVCKPGASVALVNDNVRYSGEVIPVDMLLTDFAAQLGFLPQCIYVLPQRKGNSSQQMGKYGRAALRKSIMVWKKPLRTDAS